MGRIIDTHVHVWDLERADYPWLQGDTSILNQTWTIDQLDEEREKAGVTAGVLVQASGNLEDTELMFETARATEWVSGVVGWLPLMDPDGTHRLLEERFLNDSYFKGVRHQIHDEKNAQWLLQPTVLESLALLASHDIPFDVVGVLPVHIETALEVAQRVPRLKMVFDHLCQPPIASQEKFGRWGDLMEIAAGYPQIHAKISGLGTASGNFQNRTTGDITPYVAFALEHFGIDRCFCGGDWPVSMLANSYANTWKTYKEILNELLTAEEQERVMYSNAVNFYKLIIS